MKIHPTSFKALVLAFTAMAGGLLTAAPALATTATNTNEQPLAALPVSQAGGGTPGSTTNYVTRGQQFRLTMGSIGGDRISFVEAYTTNGSAPNPLRIGIFGNTTQANTSGGVTELVNVPNLADQKITFSPPNVTSISDGFDVFWTASFAAVGAGPTAVTRPASDDPYWIVYTLATDGTVDLNGVASEPNTQPIYFGDSASLTYSYDGSLLPPTPWVIGGRAVSTSIAYEAVPEPSAYALAAVGLMAAGLVAKRRPAATTGG